MTAPGIPNEFVLSTSCFGTRLRTIEDQAFAAVAMGFRKLELGCAETPPTLNGFVDSQRETGIRVTSVVSGCLKPSNERPVCQLLSSPNADEREQVTEKRFGGGRARRGVTEGEDHRADEREREA